MKKRRQREQNATFFPKVFTFTTSNVIAPTIAIPSLANMDHAPPRDPKIEYKKYKAMLIVLSLTKYELFKINGLCKDLRLSWAQQ